MTQDLKQNQKRSERKWLRPTANGLALVIGLALAGSIEPDPRRPAIRAAAVISPRRTDKLSVPVKGGKPQPNLSFELLHDLPADANGPTPVEVTPPLASVVAPTTAPSLRGVYTGAARTLVASHGKSRIVWLEVTAYCPCTLCCGPGALGITASGKPVDYNGGAFVAADADEFPFGAKLRIPGYHEGKVVEVIDRGSAIKHAKVDVYFPTHERAETWGRQWVAVTVEE